MTAHSDGPGRGSLFSVRLPVSRQPAAAIASTHALQPASDARRILVVDDNDDAAAIVATILRSVGHDARVAHDPSQALTIAEDFRPQIALLDIGLPVMDGYALGRELRARLGPDAPLLVALTGYGRDEDKRRSKEAAFTLHLVKPLEVDVILHHIAELVGMT